MLAPQRSENLISRSPLGGAQDKRLQLQQLAKEVRLLEKHGGEKCLGADERSQGAISTGCQPMDALLPAGGYEPGSIVEYLRSTPACGASHMAFATAACAMRASQGYLVIVDAQRTIYPPALLCHGIDLQRVIFVHPETPDDVLWAIDQGLRTSAVAAVVAEWHCIDDRSARRLQLAAESGSSLGVLIRGVASRRSPSWAEVQWVIRSGTTLAHSAETFPGPLEHVRRSSSANRRLYVQLARVRGGRAGALLRVDVNATTGEMLATQVDGRNQVDVSERNRHDPHSRNSTRVMRLATQLGHTTSSSRRA